jgi:enoyl-CoA hydratase/carnithine racemase
MKLTSGLVGAEARGPIGWLIWDNPSKLNALSPGMYEDALNVVEEYAADPAIQVMVMRGAGRKAFISGADHQKFREDVNFTRSWGVSRPEASSESYLRQRPYRRDLIMTSRLIWRCALHRSEPARQKQPS